MKKIFNIFIATLVIVLIITIMILTAYYGLFRNELSIMGKLYIQLILAIMLFIILKICMYF